MVYVPSLGAALLKSAVPVAGIAYDLFAAARETTEKLGLDPNWAVPQIIERLGDELENLSDEDRLALTGMTVEALSVYLPALQGDAPYNPEEHAKRALKKARKNGLDPAELEDVLLLLLRAFFETYLSHESVFGQLAPQALQELSRQFERFDQGLDARVTQLMRNRELTRAWEAAVNTPYALEPAKELGFWAVSAKRGVVGFTETAVFREVEELLGKLASPVVLHFAAPGGYGKTRFWMEMSRRLAARGWAGGFLNPQARYGDLLTIFGAEKRPLFMVLDYAELRYDDVKNVLDAAAKAGLRGPFVLALLSRAPVTHVENLRNSTSDERATGLAAWLAGVEERGFSLSEFEPKEARGIFLAAYRALSRLEGSRPAADDEAAWEQLGGELKKYPLNLVLAAYLKVVGADTGSAGAEGLIEKLVEHETKKALKASGVDEGWKERYEQHARALERLMAAAALAGGFSSEEAGRHARGGYVLSGEAGEYVDKPLRLRDALRRTLPGPDGSIAPLEPDPVADYLLRKLADEDRGAFAAMVRGVLEAPEGREGRYARLRRVSDVLQRAFSGDVALGLLEQAFAGMSGYPFADLGIQLINESQNDGGKLKFDPNAPMLTHVLFAALLPRAAREIGQSELRAAVFLHAGVALSHFGQHQAALEATREAVELYRQLAEQNPDRFRPDLAMSLNNLGNRLSSLGQHHEALEATQESVNIYRQLAEQNPDRFLPDLAGSLNNLGRDLSSLGRHQEAQEAAWDALNIKNKIK